MKFIQGPPTNVKDLIIKRKKIKFNSDIKTVKETYDPPERAKTSHGVSRSRTNKILSPAKEFKTISDLTSLK